MMEYTYMALIAFTALPVVLKYRDPNLPLRRNLRPALLATGIVAVPFLVWDVVVTEAGHWSFSESYTIGWRVLNLPIEEVLFFVAVPLAGVLVWETVGYFLKR